jgi:hypothetical protein
MTDDDIRIIEAARDIRGQLRDIAGADADELDRALVPLLERAEAGENVADAILAVLQSNHATRQWLADRLAGSSAKPPEPVPPPPVAPQSPPASPPPPGRPTTRGLDFNRYRTDAEGDREPTRGGLTGGTRGGLTGGSRSSRPRERVGSAATYALVECPDVLVATEEFELVVGLASKPSPGVDSEGPMAVPTTDYWLTIDVHAEGFTLKHGETWRQSVKVTDEKPHPRLPLHLTPKAQAEPYKPRTIKASYSIDGQVVGMATRFVVVTSPATDIDAVPAPPVSPGTDVMVPAARTAPDLTARILIGEDDPDKAFWVLVSPWDGEVTIPADSYEHEIGDAKAFLTSLVDDVSAAEGQTAPYEELLGVGRRIANLIPDEFWSALHAVHEHLKATPTLLFLSEEPYIPWELALLDEPLDADPAVPPFLGAQANVARWILGDKTPVQPPPRERLVSAMAVVAGDYSNSDWDELPEATREAKSLAGEYKAMAVDADLRTVLELLKGNPKVDLVHFAVHGQYDGEVGRDGLIMVDGQILNGNKVLARPLDGPFVFLNACQVGAGNKILAGAAGLAADFVNAGASGVVAPLWSVKDTIAREIAEEFYARVFGDPRVSPAVALRECRAKFRDDPAASPTYLAYQFFGGPNMTLIRESAPDPG